MKKKYFTLGLLSLGLLLTVPGCTKKANNVNDDCANINIIVKDYTTSNAINGAKVTLMANKTDSKKTDVYGRASYNNIRMGTYQILCEMNGYASVYYPALLNYDALEKDIAVGDITVVASMFPTTGKITGKIYEADPVTSVKVKNTRSYELDVTYTSPLSGSGVQFVNKPKITTSNGEYTIENAPVKCNYSIAPRNLTADNFLHSASEVNGSVGLSNVSYAPDITYSKTSLATTNGLPNVTNLRTTTTVTSSTTSFNLLWNAVPEAVTYIICISRNATSDYTVDGSTYSTSYTLYGFSVSSTNPLFVKVVARASNGTGSDLTSTFYLTLIPTA